MSREAEGMLLGFLGALGIVGAFLTWRGYKAKRARRDNARFLGTLGSGHVHTDDCKAWCVFHPEGPWDQEFRVTVSKREGI